MAQPSLVLKPFNQVRSRRSCAPHRPALFIPNPLSAPFAPEKADRLSLFGIEKLMGEFKGGGTCRAPQTPISWRCPLIVVHAPSLPYQR